MCVCGGGGGDLIGVFVPVNPERVDMITCVLVSAVEAHSQLPVGTITQIIVKSGTDGVWQRLEQGDITLSEFATAFSKECSQKVKQIEH